MLPDMLNLYKWIDSSEVFSPSPADIKHDKRQIQSANSRTKRNLNSMLSFLFDE